MSHPTFCVCRLCAPFASQGLTLGLAHGHGNDQAANQLLIQGIQGQAAIGGQLGDPYDQRMAQFAALVQTAPGPLPGYPCHDDEPTDCGVPGCYVCEGKLG